MSSSQPPPKRQRRDRDSITGETDGIDFLFGQQFAISLLTASERIAFSYQITLEEALQELRRFLVLKVFVSDKDSNKLDPTPLMNAVLDTQMYANLQTALGVTIHHAPSNMDVCAFHDIRIAAMEGLYKGFFKTDPIGPAPPRLDNLQLNDGLRKEISLKIQIIAGKRVPITISSRATVRQLKSAIQDKEDIPIDQMRLLNVPMGGHVLQNDLMLEQYGIHDGQIIPLWLRLAGC
ncbi:hypothetical protein IFR04_001386 [Cadophora malorum]|uniref:Ubiquitin-like domain-containing protein n=1 Tax=Cadophora malorum TaxID=108018 RepID=A0A8H8BVJ6_9HELO|nr:hypothetical protein IFR04_001386 [Cadophora malorum]